MHTDFLGREIKKGDSVISYGGYTGLRWGTVVGLTPKMVKILFQSKSRNVKPQTMYGQDVIIMSEDQQQALVVKLLTQPES